jgi:hypothetical protein
MSQMAQSFLVKKSGTYWISANQYLSVSRPRFPKIVSYVLSFIYLEIYWNNHHHLLHTVVRVDGLILWANSFLLHGFRFRQSSRGIYPSLIAARGSFVVSAF